MPVSNRGRFENPAKSPYNFEDYHSDLECHMMERLEEDPDVIKWTKAHRITIAWIDGQKHRRRYWPDFLVEYSDGSKVLIEVKAAHLVDSPDVLRKRKAAEIWCEQRHMEYVIATIG